MHDVSDHDDPEYDDTDMSSAEFDAILARSEPVDVMVPSPSLLWTTSTGYVSISATNDSGSQGEIRSVPASFPPAIREPRPATV